MGTGTEPYLPIFRQFRKQADTGIGRCLFTNELFVERQEPVAFLDVLSCFDKDRKSFSLQPDCIDSDMKQVFRPSDAVSPMA